MSMDDEGFLYPVINEEFCINCGLCKRVCPIDNREMVFAISDDIYKEPVSLGGWHKDSSIREKSSSGGAFTLFAEYIIERGGTVFGCTLNKNNEAVHIGINLQEDLKKLRKAKYVQSILGNTYSQIKEFLEKGENCPVLFVGTPCQVAGLKRFLGKGYSELYAIDFICHGVSSPKVFKAYISDLEKTKGNKIVDFSFRNKDYGWYQSGLQLGTKAVFADGTVLRHFPAFRDSYMNGFLNDIFLRPSCYNCKFKSLPNYYADFTIADFWGVDNVSKALNDGKGTSLILIHNQHATKLWDMVSPNFEYRKVSFYDAIKKNPALLKSAKYNKKRKSFFESFNRFGFLYVKRKYMSVLSWMLHKMLCVLEEKFGHF